MCIIVYTKKKGAYAKMKIGRYKIVSWFRFTRFLLIIAIFTVFCLISIVNASDFKVDIEKEQNDLLTRYEKVEVIVQAGDTAWTIQNRLSPNSDPRELIFHASNVNDKNMGYINAGETLVFFKERD